MFKVFVFLLCTVKIITCSGWSSGPEGLINLGSSQSKRCSARKCISSRKKALHDMLKFAQVAGSIAIAPDRALSANLPLSTGADISKTGTIDALASIVSLQAMLLDAKAVLNSIPKKSTLSSETTALLASKLENIPQNEKLFKRIFDEYSQPVSYKQKFMDQNAFLVYYSKGFDGPNRPSMESGEIPKQTLQYGARNDVWAALDEVFTELAFSRSSPGSSVCSDVEYPLDKALNALDAYLLLSPPSDVEIAKKRIRRIVQ